MKDREIVATTEIPREKSWIYFVGTDDKGNVTIERAKPMGRPRPETIRKDKGKPRENKNEEAN